ncbi:MAG: hypothetical protein ACLVB1_02925 [Blautia obeum]
MWSSKSDSRPFSVEEFMDTYRQCEELVEKENPLYWYFQYDHPETEAVLPLMKIKPAACELNPSMLPAAEQYDYLVAHNISR